MELAAAGDTRVVVAYREDAARAEETVAQLRTRGAEALAVAADVRSAEQVKRLAERVGELGGADVLVNNAGVIKDSLFAFMKEEDWRYVLDVDLDGAFRVTRSLIRGMLHKSSGRIVNVVSVSGISGHVGQTNYSAAKAGMIGFTKALALENAKKGVTVNCIAPGYIDTEMVQAVPEKVLEAIIAQIPVGRLGRGEEIADMVAFLAGEHAGYVTGSTLSLNGGQFMAG